MRSRRGIDIARAGRGVSDQAFAHRLSRVARQRVEVLGGLVGEDDRLHIDTMSDIIAPWKDIWLRKNVPEFGTFSLFPGLEHATPSQ
jgi:hypothetical protein